MSQLFWAEEIAERAEARHGAPYVVSDWKTPSGRIHVGALRGVLLHDAVARALRSRGHAVRYIYGFDDFDPFDKVPNYLIHDAYAPYLGKPMDTVPAPDATGQPLSEIGPDTNYARFYADEFETVYRSLGVESETLRAGELYRSGVMDAAIRLVLDHAAQVTTAYETVIAHRSSDRQAKPLIVGLPINMICESCGRIATTVANDWDGERVTYDCRDGVVPYVGGCGHHGHASPFGGNAKLPWKVDWPAKWWRFETDVEGAGKDHYTKGGSRDVGLEIFKRVFLGVRPPEATHDPMMLEDLFYEWFYMGGKKMSTSKGVGASAHQVAQAVPGELLRFLMVRTKPKSGVDFDPSADTVAQLFDEYDRVLAKANQQPDGVEAAIMRAAAIESKALPTFMLRFSKIVSLRTHNAKSGDDIRALAAAEKGAPLTESEQHELDRRLAFAEQSDADEPLPSSDAAALDADQRSFLASLRVRLESLSENTWGADALRDVVYAAKDEVGIESKRAFQAIYRSLLGSDAGPRVGELMVREGRNRVLDRLKTLEE